MDYASSAEYALDKVVTQSSDAEFHVTFAGSSKKGFKEIYACVYYPVRAAALLYLKSTKYAKLMNGR